jgi:AcrR family transcriptional regulator
VTATRVKSVREEILEAARGVFTEHGYRKASLDAVGDRAGLTRQGVLHYFPSKKRLLLAVLQDWEDQARAHLGPPPVDDAADAADAADATYGAGVVGHFARAVAWDRDHPGYSRAFSVIVAEAATGEEPAGSYLRERNRVLRDRVAAELAGRYGPLLPSGLTPSMAAAAVLALVEGAHLQLLADPGSGDTAESAAAALALLIEGRPPNPGPSPGTCPVGCAGGPVPAPGPGRDQASYTTVTSGVVGSA